MRAQYKNTCFVVAVYLFLAGMLAIPAHAGDPKWERHSINGISFELPGTPDVEVQQGLTIMTSHTPAASYTVHVGPQKTPAGQRHVAVNTRVNAEAKAAQCDSRTAKRSTGKIGSFFYMDVICKTTVGGPAAFRTMTNGKVMAVLVIVTPDKSLQRRFLEAVRSVSK